MKKITIALAMYKPRLDWLAELLSSLDAQTYENLELLVWNDCPEDNDHEEVFSQYLTRVPFKIYHGEENHGSNMAFQRLTEIAESDYIAYCDQDDIWLEEKLAVLVEELEQSQSDLVYSDMYVIDGESKVVADSITKVHRHYVFRGDENAFEKLLQKGFVTGCTMLVKTETAKAALPFPEETFHDYWLALYAAGTGKIHFVNKPLIKYRVYGDNQSATLKGVFSIQDYYERKILPYLALMHKLEICLHGCASREKMKCAIDWGKARKKYFLSPSYKTFAELIKFLSYQRSITAFELTFPFCPDALFNFLVREIRKNRL